MLRGRGVLGQPWLRLLRSWKMRVNVGQAKTDLSKLLARVEAGEEVEIARDGVPVARLVRVEPSTPASRFLAAHGRLADSIAIQDDFEFSDAEIDAMLADPE
jgi:prevent-host-death family protein